MKKINFTRFTLISLAIVLLLLIGWQLYYYLFGGQEVPVLHPRGAIADKENQLIWLVTILMLIVVVPVFVMTFLFVWKFKEGNKKAEYDPEWDHDTTIELTWWLVPLVIVLLISAVTWKFTHDLDPYKPVDDQEKALEIQVVALQWKWLFIYPEQQIASVNYLEIPARKPIRFLITAQAPMNSFWVPGLSGQIFAMPGMRTELNLIASTEDTFYGSSANISGQGFAHMHFTVNSTSEEQFATWAQQLKQQGQPLDLASYEELARPGITNDVTYYKLKEKNLFNTIIKRYMIPPHKHEGSTL